MIGVTKMSRIKLSFLVAILTIFFSVLIGCNSTQKIENSPSTSDAAKPKQTKAANQVTNAPSKSDSPSADTKTKIYRDNLCADDEEVLFSFKLANSPKTLSVCVSKIQPDYIIFVLEL